MKIKPLALAAATAFAVTAPAHAADTKPAAPQASAASMGVAKRLI